MACVKFIELKGRRILFIDFAFSSMKDIISTIEEASLIIEKQAPLSVLCLVDVRESSYDNTISEKLKIFTSHNMPYMKVTAIAGVEKTEKTIKVIYQAVTAFTGRKNLILKDTVEEGANWLAAQ